MSSSCLRSATDRVRASWLALFAGSGVALIGALLIVSPAAATFPGPVGRIVFTGTSPDGNPAICTVMPSGGSLAYVRDEVPGGTPSYDWSPGGEAIGFNAAVDNLGRSVDEVATVAPDGGAFRLLTDLSEGANYDPGWSPDGARIVYGSAQVEQDARGLRVMNADGSAKLEWYDSFALEPRWSPDGTQIAFAADLLGGYGVKVMSASGGEPVTIAGIHSGSPDWRPDGALIAYRDGSGISTVNPDGSDARHVPGTVQNDTSPSWSPDGTMMAYNHLLISFDESGNLRSGTEVHVIRPDGSGDRVLLSASQTIGGDLAWGSAPVGAVGTRQCAQGQGSSTDSTPPERPGGLKATAGTHRVTLRWRPVAAADRASYAVYKVLVGRRIRIGTTPSSATPRFTVRKLKNGRRYRFDVTALDSSDNESEHSASASATPDLPCVVPKLAGLSVRDARRALDKAHCRPGVVKKPKGIRSTRGLVVAGSRPRAHARPPRSKKVTLVLRHR